MATLTEMILVPREACDGPRDGVRAVRRCHEMSRPPGHRTLAVWRPRSCSVTPSGRPSEAFPGAPASLPGLRQFGRVAGAGRLYADAPTTKGAEMDYGEMTTGTRDEHYNLVSVLYHALQGADNCDHYALDAESAGDERLAAFFREAQGGQMLLAERAKELLGISTPASGTDLPTDPQEAVVEEVVADAEVDSVGTVLNEPPVSDVPESPADPPAPDDITPRDR